MKLPTFPFAGASYPPSFTMAPVTAIILYSVTNQLFVELRLSRSENIYSVENSRKGLVRTMGRRGYGLVQRCIPAVIEKCPEKRSIIRSIFSSWISWITAVFDCLYQHDFMCNYVPNFELPYVFLSSGESGSEEVSTRLWTHYPHFFWRQTRIRNP